MRKEQVMIKQHFNVTGMTCSACSARVEKAVSRLDGVKDVSVNLLKNSMSLTYDDRCDTDTIIKAVESAGYGASPKDTDSDTAQNKKNAETDEFSETKKRFFLSLIFTLPLFYISMGHMMSWPLPSFFLGVENALIFAFTQLLLGLPVVFINFKYYKNGFKNLVHLSPNMDSLIAIGSGAAIVYGIYSIYKMAHGMGHGDFELVHEFMMNLYFESGAMILTLITLGKTLEARAKRKTSEAITKLMDLAPKFATVLRDGEEITVPIAEIKVGDTVIVKAGESIPSDGTVVDGFASVDESALTGESVPVDKKLGDTVIGATIIRSGYVKIRVDKTGDDTALSQIIKLVDEATSSKAPIAKLADKVSGIFVPTVIAIALVCVVVWLIAGYGVEFAVSVGTSVLVISCPCALGLATPTAIMVGTGRGASSGILIKSAEALELARQVTTVVFDKTGTLTEGNMRVADIVLKDAEEDELLFIAGTLENASEHPIAKAIVNEAKTRGTSLGNAKDFMQIAGGGIKGEVDGETCFAGNRRLMEEQGFFDTWALEVEDRLSGDGKTPIFILKGKRLLGVIAVADTVKENASNTVSELSKMGIEVVMLTGDNNKTASAVAKQIGNIKTVSDLLPGDKEAEIRRMQNEGKTVAMVGDGINDSPALARADVGIAIGTGTDIAIEAADIVLMKSDTLDVVRAIKLSRATMRNIKQNLFWAFIYNIIGIPIAAGLFYIPFGLKLNPMIGALAMSFSSVFVVTNALRLKRFKLDEAPKISHEAGEKTLIIHKMFCSHCVSRVKSALEALDGVESARVDLDSKSAVVVLSKDVSDKTLKEAVEKSGYKVSKIR